MCGICYDLSRNKLSTIEARQNLEEMVNDISPEHYEEVLNRLDSEALSGWKDDPYTDKTIEDSFYGYNDNDDGPWSEYDDIEPIEYEE